MLDDGDRRTYCHSPNSSAQPGSIEFAVSVDSPVDWVKAKKDAKEQTAANIKHLASSAFVPRHLLSAHAYDDHYCVVEFERIPDENDGERVSADDEEDEDPIGREYRLLPKVYLHPIRVLAHSVIRSLFTRSHAASLGRPLRRSETACAIEHARLQVYAALVDEIRALPIFPPPAASHHLASVNSWFVENYLGDARGKHNPLCHEESYHRIIQKTGLFETSILHCTLFSEHGWCSSQVC